MIAGLTQHTDLFISQQFARENGKALRQFGMHDCRGCRTLTHVVPADITLDFRESVAWPEEIALSMIGRREFNARTITHSSATLRASDHPGSLFSWIIV